MNKKKEEEGVAWKVSLSSSLCSCYSFCWFDVLASYTIAIPAEMYNEQDPALDFHGRRQRLNYRVGGRQWGSKTFLRMISANQERKEKLTFFFFFKATTDL